MDHDTARLIEKLRAIEALFGRPGSEGERAAAANARERILERLRAASATDPPVEYRFSMPDMWSRRVFVALLRRYDLHPYRYSGQRYTTVMAKVPKRFVDETLWPEFEALSATLRTYLEDVTTRVVAEVLHADTSEAAVREAPPQLSNDLPHAEPAGAQSPAGAQTPAGAPQPRPGDARRRKKKRKRR
ncbi:MAG: hypothetical protein KF729_29195 [Sandaracinaceae bacterium]|nr:hypothetical protein [Sandaracinaceae bacterium]